MYMCNIYIHTQTNTCMHTCMSEWHMCVCVCVYVCVYIYIYYTCTSIYLSICVCVCAVKYRYMYMCACSTHTHTHTHTHYLHTHTYVVLQERLAVLGSFRCVRWGTSPQNESSLARTTHHSHPPQFVGHFQVETTLGRWERESNVLFNDTLNTFHLRLYGVGHMVKDHSDSEKGNPLPPHRLLLSINSKGSFICTIPQTG